MLIVPQRSTPSGIGAISLMTMTFKEDLLPRIARYRV